MDFLLLIYPISLLALYFYKCEVAKGDTFIEDPFSKNEAKMLQAIACIFVILHHLTQVITSYGDLNRGPITLLSQMGILFTSVFFFFSGYGLIINVSSKPSYLDNFLRHRLSTVLVPFFVANIIAVIIRIFYMKINMSPTQIVKCVLGLVLINGNGWYIVEIFIIYLAFYVLFRFIKNYKISTVLLCLFIASLIYIGYSRGHDTSTLGNHWFMGEWWYNSTIVFIQGVLFGCFKERVLSIVKRHYSILITVFTLLFIICFYIEEIIRKRYGYYYETMIIDTINSKLLTLASQMLLCLVFTTLVLLAHMKIKVGNKVLKWISSITMEIFLLHGLFINYIFEIKRKNTFVYFAVIIGCSFIAASVVHLLDAKIIALINTAPISRSYSEARWMDLFHITKEKKSNIKNIIIGIVCIIALTTAFRYVIWLPIECRNEIKELESAKVNDIVKFGRYEIEPARPFKERVEWIVLKKAEGKLLLVTKAGIESRSYNKKHIEVSYEESDIYNFLNEELFDKLFSDYEKKYIIPETDSSGYISLLTEKQAEYYFKDDLSRQVLVTPYALKKGANINTPSKINSWDYKDYRTSWWWLKGNTRITAPIVSAEGTIERDEKYVNKPNGAVRPAIWVSIE